MRVEWAWPQPSIGLEAPRQRFRVDDREVPFWAVSDCAMLCRGNFETAQMLCRWKFVHAYISSARAEAVMDGIIYLVGLIVIIMFILSFLGLH